MLVDQLTQMSLKTFVGALLSSALSNKRSALICHFCELAEHGLLVIVLHRDDLGTISSQIISTFVVALRFTDSAGPVLIFSLCFHLDNLGKLRIELILDAFLDLFDPLVNSQPLETRANVARVTQVPNTFTVNAH